MEKDELDVNLLSFSGKYIELHGRVTGKPDYKASQKLKDYQKELKGDEDAKIKMYPSQRLYAKYSWSGFSGLCYEKPKARWYYN